MKEVLLLPVVMQEMQPMDRVTVAMPKLTRVAQRLHPAPVEVAETAAVEPAPESEVMADKVEPVEAEEAV